MHDKDIYEYAIIRLVPLVERGEYINIGVILLAKHRDYLAMKCHLDEEKIACFAPDTSIGQIRSYLKSWSLICHGGPTGGRIGMMDIRFRFRWLTAARSTIIQSSPVHPGRGNDPEYILDSLMKRYVL